MRVQGSILVYDELDDCKVMNITYANGTFCLELAACISVPPLACWRSWRFGSGTFQWPRSEAKCANSSIKVPQRLADVLFRRQPAACVWTWRFGWCIYVTADGVLWVVQVHLQHFLSTTTVYESHSGFKQTLFRFAKIKIVSHFSLKLCQVTSQVLVGLK